MLAALPLMVPTAYAQSSEAPANADPAQPSMKPPPPTAATPGSPETTTKQDKPKSPDEPAPDAVNPTRFGKAPVDEAFGAYQRGLYKTAYNLALPRAEAGDGAAQILLAEILARGLGIPVNMTEFGKMVRQGRRTGHPGGAVPLCRNPASRQIRAQGPQEGERIDEGRRRRRECRGAVQFRTNPHAGASWSCWS